MCQFKVLSVGSHKIQLKRTLDYMQSNLLRDLRLKELSCVAGLSPSQFGRAFKASTGLTHHRWITQRRIQLAQQLMRDGGKSIAEACHMAGVANQNHFTKSFRGLTGATPRKWLREMAPEARQPVLPK